MDHDDDLIGKVLTRREVLKAFGAAGMASLLAACGIGPTATAPAATTIPAEAGSVCVVRPELAEGPFFFDERLNRSDIRSDPASGAISAGVPLTLAVTVLRMTEAACEVYPGVTVDVWHCDAAGAYSGVDDVQGANAEKQFLRGYQVTDQQGLATFTTIYPGWYPGRAVHIHFKLRTDPDSDQGTEFTSQWFFDETVTDQVFTAEPYAARGRRNTLNTSDFLFNMVGEQMILDVTPTAEGYTAAFTLAIDESAGV